MCIRLPNNSKYLYNRLHHFHPHSHLVCYRWENQIYKVHYHIRMCHYCYSLEIMWWCNNNNAALEYNTGNTTLCHTVLYMYNALGHWFGGTCIRNTFKLLFVRLTDAYRYMSYFHTSVTVVRGKNMLIYINIFIFSFVSDTTFINIILRTNYSPHSPSFSITLLIEISLFTFSSLNPSNPSTDEESWSTVRETGHHEPGTCGILGWLACSRAKTLQMKQKYDVHCCIYIVLRITMSKFCTLKQTLILLL